MSATALARLLAEEPDLAPYRPELEAHRPCLGWDMFLIRYQSVEPMIGLPSWIILKDGATRVFSSGYRQDQVIEEIERLEGVIPPAEVVLARLRTCPVSRWIEAGLGRQALTLRLFFPVEEADWVPRHLPGAGIVRIDGATYVRYRIRPASDRELYMTIGIFLSMAKARNAKRSGDTDAIAGMCITDDAAEPLVIGLADAERWLAP